MKRILYLFFALTFVFVACDDTDDAYVLQRDDIVILAPETGYITEVGQVFRLEVKSVSDEGLAYQWLMGAQVLSNTKSLEYVFKTSGQYTLKLVVTQGEVMYQYNVVVEVKGKDVPQEHYSPYIAQVLDYRPAPGQFVNELPKYTVGDTPEDMNRKAFEAIGKNNLGLITLGGFGGYIVFSFDHTLQNVEGKRDFRIMGNAFEGSAEPGIVMVSVDVNGNGLADDAWYELAGSAHRNSSDEIWYEQAKMAGNDVRLYRNYEIIYHRPAVEPEEDKNFGSYIRWEDNQGNGGYKSKNIYHAQPYYPQWLKEENLTFQGTCLPQNGLDKSGEGTYFVCQKFAFGYADNDLNESLGATFDIDWAVDEAGRKVSLKGIDFIKVYTGVNQENGWIGECSTEISGAEDLHILGEDIDSPAL